MAPDIALCLKGCPVQSSGMVLIHSGYGTSKILAAKAKSFNNSIYICKNGCKLILVSEQYLEQQKLSLILINNFVD